MEKPIRARQWYGYLVCLVAVVTALICVAGALNNAFDLSNPIAAGGRLGESLSSFEAYQATRSAAPADQRPGADTASDATLRARFEALRADRIGQRVFEARKGLIINVVMLLIAIGLFVFHWRWLRHLPAAEVHA